MKTKDYLLPAIIAALIGFCGTLFTGCGAAQERLASSEGRIAYAIGQGIFHAELQEKASDHMLDFLESHPAAVDSLPQLDLAWTHFWQNENPFTRSQFDAWLALQKAKLDLPAYHAASLDALSGLLWSYLEADAAGYVDPSPRTRRIVDSLVAGLRSGYRLHVST
jgi:hypothetical protein